MIQETQDHNSSNTTSQDQEKKPLIKCEWNGHDINSTTITKKKKLIVKSFDLVKSLDKIII
jgi:hypothetical protein